MLLLILLLIVIFLAFIGIIMVAWHFLPIIIIIIIIYIIYKKIKGEKIFGGSHTKFYRSNNYNYSNTNQQNMNFEDIFESDFFKDFMNSNFGNGNYDNGSFQNQNFGNIDQYYDKLGVAKVSSAQEIKTAYKKLARLYHPDMQSGKSEYEKNISEEKFKEINEAYFIIRKNRSDLK